MNINNDDVTLEITNNSVTVYKNGTRFGTIGAVNVVNAFVDQDEIVLEYCLDFGHFSQPSTPFKSII